MRERLLRPAKDSRYALLAHEPLQILWAHPEGRECRRTRDYEMSGRRSWVVGQFEGAIWSTAMASSSPPSARSTKPKRPRATARCVSASGACLSEPAGQREEARGRR